MPCVGAHRIWIVDCVANVDEPIHEHERTIDVAGIAALDTGVVERLRKRSKCDVEIQRGSTKTRVLIANSSEWDKN